MDYNGYDIWHKTAETVRKEAILTLIADIKGVLFCAISGGITSMTVNASISGKIGQI